MRKQFARNPTDIPSTFHINLCIARMRANMDTDDAFDDSGNGSAGCHLGPCHDGLQDSQTPTQQQLNSYAMPHLMAYM